MDKKDYYAILNIDPKATVKEIKSAYRQMALKYHPDHNPHNPNAAEQFGLVQMAYEVLGHSESRKKYDRYYTPRPQKPAPEPPRKTRSATSKPQKSKNLRYNLYVRLEDLVHETERSIRFMRTGKKEKETVQIKVKIPRGAFHHQRLKVARYGDWDGKTWGDLFVIVHIQNHPIFFQQGLDLRVNVPINYLDAALGSVISVPTLSGAKKLKLRYCEFDDLDHTFKGLGIPDPKGMGRGDLHIHCFIEHPKRLSTQEKNAMQKAQRTWPKGELVEQYQTYMKENKLK